MNQDEAFASDPHRPSRLRSRSLPLSSSDDLPRLVLAFVSNNRRHLSVVPAARVRLVPSTCDFIPNFVKSPSGRGKTRGEKGG